MREAGEDNKAIYLMRQLLERGVRSSSNTQQYKEYYHVNSFSEARPFIHAHLAPLRAP